MRCTAVRSARSGYAAHATSVAFARTAWSRWSSAPLMSSIAAGSLSRSSSPCSAITRRRSEPREPQLTRRPLLRVDLLDQHGGDGGGAELRRVARREQRVGRLRARARVRVVELLAPRLEDRLGVGEQRARGVPAAALSWHSSARSGVDARNTCTILSAAVLFSTRTHAAAACRGSTPRLGSVSAIGDRRLAQAPRLRVELPHHLVAEELDQQPSRWRTPSASGSPAAAGHHRRALRVLAHHRRRPHHALVVRALRTRARQRRRRRRRRRLRRRPRRRTGRRPRRRARRRSGRRAGRRSRRREDRAGAALRRDGLPRRRPRRREVVGRRLWRLERRHRQRRCASSGDVSGALGGKEGAPAPGGGSPPGVPLPAAPAPMGDGAPGDAAATGCSGAGRGDAAADALRGDDAAGDAAAAAATRRRRRLRRRVFAVLRAARGAADRTLVVAPRRRHAADRGDGEALRRLLRRRRLRRRHLSACSAMLSIAPGGARLLELDLIGERLVTEGGRHLAARRRRRRAERRARRRRPPRRRRRGRPGGGGTARGGAARRRSP